MTKDRYKIEAQTTKFYRHDVDDEGQPTEMLEDYETLSVRVYQIVDTKKDKRIIAKTFKKAQQMVDTMYAEGSE